MTGLAADPVELLVALVRTASPSGQEERAAAMLENWARERGLAVHKDDAAVRIVVEGRAVGPTLLLASHLDTVPPGAGWTVDPYAGVVTDNRLTGRGAVDAKASVAAMATAAATLAAEGGPSRGRLVVLATYGEETRDTTMPEALRRLESAPEAAIVGEPTALVPCIAQRGQLLLRIVWRGEQVHAGWAAGREPRPVNAIEVAAKDISRLGGLVFERRHDTLGEVAVSVTMINAGIARNVTPPRCEAVLDVRTTPAYTHAEVIEAIRRHLGGDVEVISDRLVAVATPAGSRLLATVRVVQPDAIPFASPTCSDWVFLRNVDTVKLGPGESRQSHTLDESIDLAEVRRAADVYAAITRRYLQ